MKYTIIFLAIVCFSVTSLFFIDSNIITLINGFATGIWFSIANNREWFFTSHEENDDWEFTRDHYNKF